MYIFQNLKRQLILVTCQTYNKCDTDEYFATVTIKKSLLGFSYTQQLNLALVQNNILLKLQSIL